MKFLLSLLTSIAALLTVVEAKANSEGGFINPIQTTTIQSETLSNTNTPSIEDAYRDVFGNNVYHVSQQTMSVLLPFAEMKGMVQRSMSLDRIGAMGTPNKYLARGSKVYASNPVNDVRWLEAERYWLACFIDQYDQLRTLWNIQNAYTVAMARSFARLYDRVFIAAALGSVSTGARSNTGTVVTLPTTQQFLAIDTSKSTAAVAKGLNIETIARVRKHMKETFAIEKGETAVWAIRANEVHALLQEVEVQSRDYNSIQPLLSGELASFYGFVFAETELIPVSTLTTSVNFSNSTGQRQSGSSNKLNLASGKKYNRTFAFTGGSAVCFGINQNILSRISERPDTHYNHQLYYASEFGAVRREEVKVVEVLSEQV